MGSKLQADSRALAQNIFRLKTAEKQSPKKTRQAEVRLKKQIDMLEENKQRLEVFIESYLAANQVRLQFRIFRQVGPHRIPLLAMVDE